MGASDSKQDPLDTGTGAAPAVPAPAAPAAGGPLPAEPAPAAPAAPTAPAAPPASMRRPVPHIAVGSMTAPPPAATAAASASPVAAAARRYVVTGELGRGAFSTVYQAEDRVTRLPVAVKHVQFQGDEHQRSVAERELHILSTIAQRVKDRHVLQYFHHWFDGSSVFIVTELCTGGELFDNIVKNGSFSEQHAANLIREALLGIQVLHDNNIIHRDIKPENLLFRSTSADPSDLVICDFGLAHVMDLPDVHRALVGSPGYVAPEVLTGRHYSPACDVWGLGVILYILLCGYPPFHNHDRKALYAAIQSGSFNFPAEPWDSISPAAKDLILRMLTVDPTHRYTAVQALDHPWLVAANPAPMAHLVPALKQFNARRKLRSAAYACIWGRAFLSRASIQANSPSMFVACRHQLVAQCNPGADTSLAELKKAFWRVARDGSVDLTQFRQVLRDANCTVSNPDVLFALFDADKNGHVDYREFLAGIALTRATDEGVLRECFKIFDENCDGVISVGELAKILAFVGQADLTFELERADRLANVFEQLDTNHDNAISWEEFETGLRSDPELAAMMLRAASSSTTPRNSSVSVDIAAGAQNDAKRRRTD